VANADFEGGGDDHGYGDYIFLVIYAQPSHARARILHLHSGGDVRQCLLFTVPVVPTSKFSPYPWLVMVLVMYNIRIAITGTGLLPTPQRKNHARRLRLGELLCLELSRSPSGYFVFYI
jgi:hypothetical protein